jgi:hypothetical protein
MPRFKRTPSLPSSIPKSTAFWKEKKRMMIESRVRERERKRRGRRREEKRETVRPEEDQPIQPPFPAVFLSILPKGGR